MSPGGSAGPLGATAAATAAGWQQLLAQGCLAAAAAWGAAFLGGRSVGECRSMCVVQACGGFVREAGMDTVQQGFGGEAHRRCCLGSLHVHRVYVVHTWVSTCIWTCAHMCSGHGLEMSVGL
jgi:hypothetical protein